jgi:ELWxxDGT repeat protein
MLGGQLYFASSPPEGTDFELVRTNATAAGTIRVADIEPGTVGSAPRGLITARTAFGDRLFFSAQTSQHGREAWISDGTQQGTRLLADLFPGKRDSNPLNFFEIAPGRIIFVADDGLTGAELWETDGTEAGTRLLADINPGTEPSSPSNFAIVDGRLWFSAFTRAAGRELWSMSLAATSACDYDFNRDENVDLLDAQQMAQVFVGLITPQAGWLDGDLNGDENADLTDAQLLAAFVVTGVCGV